MKLDKAGLATTIAVFSTVVAPAWMLAQTPGCAEPVAVDVVFEPALGSPDEADSEFANLLSSMVEAKLSEHRELFAVHNRDSEMKELEKDPKLKLTPLKCLIMGSVSTGDRLLGFLKKPKPGTSESEPPGSKPPVPAEVSNLEINARIVNIKNREILGVASANVVPKNKLVLMSVAQMKKPDFAKTELGRLAGQLAQQIADQVSAQVPDLKRQLGVP
jgi:hypothetical protein